MAKDCGHIEDCGCTNALTTPPPCNQGTPECANPDPCPETFQAGCVVWTGKDLVCNTTVVATAGDRVDVIFERMIALFCAAQAPETESSVSLLIPDSDGLIIGTEDRIIGLDRNNCHETITFNPVGGPAGLLFNYTNATNVLVSGASSIVMDPSQSTIRFDLDTTTVAPGEYQFTLEATACGRTLSAPIYFNVN